jgi:hypothetical protein
MPDLELIDRLVATYRILNHLVRQKPEDVLKQGQIPARETIRKLRDSELRFSQDLKARISGQPVSFEQTGEVATIGTEGEHDTTAELIAQFGTARASTLAQLRSLADADWDTTGDYPRSIRTDVFNLVDRDRKTLDTLSQALGEPLAESAVAS